MGWLIKTIDLMDSAELFELMVSVLLMDSLKMESSMDISERFGRMETYFSLSIKMDKE